MKPPTVFLAEMTNAEVERFLADRHTVIVPVGSTEQHGPHLALSADVLIPQETAAVLAINPALVDMEKAEKTFRALPPR